MKKQYFNRLFVKQNLLNVMSSEPGLSSKPPKEPAIGPSLRSWRRLEALSLPGENASSKIVLTALETNHDLGDPALFPPEEQHQIMALATCPPEDYQRPVPTWTISELTQEVKDQKVTASISRSTVWRLLDQAEIKPHKWRYWLNSPDPDFESKMMRIVDLYLHPPKEGILLCLDEKTAIQALERKYPDKPVQAGKPYLREHSYIRHGTQDLLAALEVSTGNITAQLHNGHSSPYWEAFIVDLAKKYPQNQKLHLVQDNASTHSTPGLCRVIAEICKIPLPKLKTQKDRRAWLSMNDKRIVFHYLPTHASWLNQIEIWFGTLSKRFLKRSNFRSLQELKTKIYQFIQYYNLEFAHPYAWTYKGKPLSVDKRVYQNL